MSRPQRFVCRARWRHTACPRDQAPNPQGASGREWCYVEPQAGSFDETIVAGYNTPKMMSASWRGKAAKSLGDTAVSCGGLCAGATATAPSFVQRQDGL